MRKKKKDVEIRLFRPSVPQFPRTQRYVREYFVNCQAVSFSPHAWFHGVCSFFDHYLGDA